MGWTWLLCLWLGLTGCQYAGKLPLTKQGDPRYGRALVLYELDGLQRPLPLHEITLEQTSYDGLPPFLTNSAAWAKASLAIEYPHPSGDLTLARATLRLSAQPEEESRTRALNRAGAALGFDPLTSHAFSSGNTLPTTTRDDELWVLDLPRQQLDLLLADLQHQGFFQPQVREQCGTQLEVRVDHNHLKKEWSPEPRLDQFMLRVYREGRLGGLVSCHSPQPGEFQIAER